MKIEIADRIKSMFFQDKSEYNQQNHLLTIYIEDVELLIYLDDGELEKLRNIIK